MTLIVASIVLALVTALVLATLLRPRKSSETEKLAPLAEAEARPCPLCGSSLAPGERVHSVVYPSAQDKLMEISGCPHCRPPAKVPRICPVCKQELRPVDVVTARVFERKNETGAKKTHVHVLGCPRCRS